MLKIEECLSARDKSLIEQRQLPCPITQQLIQIEKLLSENGISNELGKILFFFFFFFKFALS
jgi:hypothetical protein